MVVIINIKHKIIMSDRSQFIPFLLGVVVGGVFTAYCKIYYKSNEYIKIHGDSTVTINSHKFTGNDICASNGKVSVNGINQGKYTESNVGQHIFNVSVTGNPEKIETMGTVVVNGNCTNVKTIGDVYVSGKCDNVHTLGFVNQVK